MILRAAGQLVQRPDDFYQAVENEKGVVELTLAGRFGAMEQIKVPPPAAGNAKESAGGNAAGNSPDEED
jgi:hypothetical protein